MVISGEVHLFIKTADFIQDRQFPGTVDLMLTNISNTTKFGLMFGLASSDIIEVRKGGFWCTRR